MKKYPRESKNVDVRTVAQNVSGQLAQTGKSQNDPVQMGGEARIKAKAKAEVVRDMDDAMRAENVRRKNPFVAAQIQAIDDAASKSQGNKFKQMFPKTSRKGK